jgi:large subunit ribosomal protein L9
MEASEMEVLLRESVVNLGARGNVVRVKPGYARNFLFPKGMAVYVTDGNKKQLEIEKRNFDKKLLEQKSSAEEARTKLEAMSLTISKKAGESNQLFGSVTSAEISALLQEKGFEVDRRRITLPHIKELGEFEASIKLHSDVNAILRLNIVSTPK